MLANLVDLGMHVIGAGVRRHALATDRLAAIRRRGRGRTLLRPVCVRPIRGARREARPVSDS